MAEVAARSRQTDEVMRDWEIQPNMEREGSESWGKVVTSRLPEAGPAYIWQLSRTQTILTDQHMSFLHTLTSLVRTRE